MPPDQKASQMVSICERSAADADELMIKMVSVRFSQSK